MESYRERIQDWLEAVPMRMRALAFLRYRKCAGEVYLVGGSVRDALLGRMAHDMDLVVDRGGLRLARELADHLGAAYVPLDTERDVGRVAWHGDGGVQYIDIASYRAATLEGDLMARDFAANAIAVSITPEIGDLIDPADGQRDIQQQLLRVTTGRSFADDPLRILRGLRQSGALGFGLDERTQDLARHGRGGLVGVSPERIRDELFQIASLPQTAEVLDFGMGLGVWAVLFGDEAVSDKVIGQVRLLDHALTRLRAESLGLLATYGDELMAHWETYVSAERSRGALLKLVAWLGGWLGSERGLRALKGLHLSRRELSIAERSLKSAGDEGFWHAEMASDLDLYRYFREYGDAGLEGAMLRWVSSCGLHDAAKLDSLFDACYCRHDAVVDPPILVNGRDLIESAGLRPGPTLGYTLEAIREAQVQNLVSDHQGAIEYARALSAVED